MARTKSSEKTGKAAGKKPRFERFAGFTKDAIRFLKELEKNNERAWFQENKARYEEVIKAPLDALTEDGERTYGSGKAFRIYRDVRFSKDKTPYKTHASAVFERDGIVHYFHLEKDHCFVATGTHMMQRDQLQRFWQAIDDGRSGKRLEKLVQEAQEAGLEIGGSALKTAPRGYAKDHERVHLLRHKGLTVSRKEKLGPWLYSAEAGPKVAAIWAEGAAINAWLRKYVGESEEGRRFVKRT